MSAKLLPSLTSFYRSCTINRCICNPPLLHCLHHHHHHHHHSDDECTFVLLAALAQFHVRVDALITTLAPSPERARLARGTLDALGLSSVPVGIGSAGGAVDDMEVHGIKDNDYLPLPSSTSVGSGAETGAGVKPGRGGDMGVESEQATAAGRGGGGGEREGIRSGSSPIHSFLGGTVEDGTTLLRRVIRNAAPKSLR